MKNIVSALAAIAILVSAGASFAADTAVAPIAEKAAEATAVVAPAADKAAEAVVADKAPEAIAAAPAEVIAPVAADKAAAPKLSPKEVKAIVKECKKANPKNRAAVKKCVADKKMAPVAAAPAIEAAPAK